MDTGQRKRIEEEGTEGASTSSFTSPIATDVGSSQYDVFLSFRGLDTRKGFTDCLYHSLVKAGTVPCCVFRDENSIPIGEEFGPEILDAIAQSKISILVISENYASSKWCLHELVHIMDRKKNTSHMVLPIFYKVAPSDVRHLKGKFGNAFHSSQERFGEKDIQEWQRALNEVSYLNGWESDKFNNGHEGELIEHVVKTVISKLQEDFQLNVPKQLVGLDDGLKKIMNWIDRLSINAGMIGIYGMGGIGKTTLAKIIYNQLLNKFKHVSFIQDVRETTKRHGITYLQSQLISDILHSKEEVSRIDDGINKIKSRFKGKKVLILLDDIDDKKQLDASVGERNWFMAGSLIIVTTRNEAVLDQSEFEVDYKYELNGLDKVHALLLFNRHAFRMDHSPKDFDGISRDIISTMGGLPLALEVVGSYLYKKKNKGVWEDVRKQLKDEPHKDVQKILRISYDALEDGQKQIFLDIVCFFVCKTSQSRESRVCAKYKWEETSKCAMCMWEDCGFYPSQAIEELKLRCLIKITDDGMFEMHDQLRDLGRSIFCQGQSLELEKHPGPWDDDFKGVSRVIRHTEGRPSCVDDILRAAAASGTSNDKLLYEVRWLELFGDNPYLPPFNLHLPKLSVLKLRGYYSSTPDWKRLNSFMASKRLKVLVLRYLNLRCTPDLSAFTQLKILILAGCEELEHLHPSIGKLTSLVSLDLGQCRRLKKLPQEVGKLKDLEELILSNTDFTEVPTIIGSLRNLKKLDFLNCKSLRKIPSSIGDLQNLQHLDLCSSEIEKLPSEIGDLPSLQILDMDETPISDLPESIRNLSSLQSLRLNGCTKLCSLPELPSGLTNLRVCCRSPTLPQLSSLIHLKDLYLGHCHLLEDIPELSSTLLKLTIEKCDKLINIPELSSRLLELAIHECDKLILLTLDRVEYLEDFYMTDCSSIERLDLSCLNHLKKLWVGDCSSIERLDLSCLNHLKDLWVLDCHNLVEIQGPDRAKFLELLDFMGCKSMKTLPDVNGCQRLEYVIVRNCEKLTQLRGFEKLDIITLETSGCNSLERTGLFDNYEQWLSFDS